MPLLSGHRSTSRPLYPAINPDSRAFVGNSAFTHRIKKELSICQSSLCLDLVSFPVLSQIKPQAPV